MADSKKPKIAVILANLGGPDSLKSVRPFLFNLFYDRAIIDLPNPLRFFVASLISITRAKKAKKIYAQIGGNSPLLINTIAQANDLKLALNEYQAVVLPMMRYWNPRAFEVVKELDVFDPDRVVLIPLYPQFSTTTTQSVIEEWNKVACKWSDKTTILDNHYENDDFIKAHQELISPVLKRACDYGKPKILFSAHSLPQKVIDGGDPYQQQIEATAASIMRVFDMDYVVCYQSKVGPLKWLEPSLDSELKKASAEKYPVVVVPISFVSDHSETLVELDIDYAEIAKNSGIPFYGRVPVLGCHPLYIKCLADSVRKLSSCSFV